MLGMNKKATIAIAAVLATGAAGTGIAVATGDDGENTAQGPGADRARAAALELYSGGRANSVERDSEDGATWEVEIERADGGQVDVRLDEDYELVVAEADTEDE